jgi:hypothetical protein
MHDAVAALLDSGEVVSLLLYLTDCCLEPPRYLGKQGVGDGAAAAEQVDNGDAAGKTKKKTKAKRAADLSAVDSQALAAPPAAPSQRPRMQIVSELHLWWRAVPFDCYRIPKFDADSPLVLSLFCLFAGPRLAWHSS